MGPLVVGHRIASPAASFIFSLGLEDATNLFNLPLLRTCCGRSLFASEQPWSFCLRNSPFLPSEAIFVPTCPLQFSHNVNVPTFLRLYETISLSDILFLEFVLLALAHAGNFGIVDQVATGECILCRFPIYGDSTAPAFLCCHWLLATRTRQR